MGADKAQVSKGGLEEDQGCLLEELMLKMSPEASVKLSYREREKKQFPQGKQLEQANHCRRKDCGANS